MSLEQQHLLEPAELDLFARKGMEVGDHIVQAGNANGVKVRRITQMLADLTARPLEQVSVLDLACGEGVYAIEAALRGARVLAIDARLERMQHGARLAKRLGLTRLTFEQSDVRKVTVESHGRFDVVYLLGILYHLDVPDVCHVLEHVAALCQGWLLIDSHVSLAAPDSFSYKGRVYRGAKVREHGDSDSEAARRAKLLMSVDNTFAFRFDKASLIRLLVDTGFTTVMECHAPLESSKPANRVTLVAREGSPVILSTYPWVNSKSEDEIAAQLRPQPSAVVESSSGLGQLVNRTLRPFGLEIRRRSTVDRTTS